MKFFSVRKIERLYYRLNVSLANMTYKRDFFMQKSAYVSFLGIPLIPKKVIYVKLSEKEIASVV